MSHGIKFARAVGNTKTLPRWHKIGTFELTPGRYWADCGPQVKENWIRGTYEDVLQSVGQMAGRGRGPIVPCKKCFGPEEEVWKILQRS